MYQRIDNQMPRRIPVRTPPASIGTLPSGGVTGMGASQIWGGFRGAFWSQYPIRGMPFQCAEKLAPFVGRTHQIQ